MYNIVVIFIFLKQSAVNYSRNYYILMTRLTNNPNILVYFEDIQSQLNNGIPTCLCIFVTLEQ